MSPLFGGKHDDADAGPTTGDDPVTAIQAEIARLAALSLPRLAAEVMAAGFGPDGPGAPDKPGTIEDPATVTFERVGSTEIARRLTPAFGGRGVGADLTGTLMNLVAEGLQLLEGGAFVRVSWTGGHAHYMATRRGRAALSAGRIDVLLSDYENT